MIHGDDVKVLSRLGRSVWVNSEDWESSTLEVMTAVSLLDVDQDQSVERAAKLLLDRARRCESKSAEGHERDLWMSPFYRLSVDQRFVLAALSGPRWKYQRLSQVLGVPTEVIEHLAWNARIQLNIPSIFPTALGQPSAQCPEYDPSQPWTQRFLDDQIATRREQLFLQTHLMDCDSCRRTLEKCRQVYYEAQKKIPMGHEADLLAESLEQVLLRRPNKRSSLLVEFSRGLLNFTMRPDVIFLLALGAVLVLHFSHRHS